MEPGEAQAAAAARETKEKLTLLEGACRGGRGSSAAGDAIGFLDIALAHWIAAYWVLTCQADVIVPRLEESATSLIDILKTPDRKDVKRP